MLNPTLSKAAATIMQSQTPAQFTVSAHFISGNPGSSFSFYPFIINAITIVQDFIQNYADVITLEMKISPKDYALMQDQGQNLLCVLCLTYLDKFGNMVYTPAPIQRQYQVLIQDAQDVRKAIPDIHLYTEPQTTVTVQLVESTVAGLRHTRLNSIYQNATMTQVVYNVAQSLNITKCHLTPLDNVHQHDHVTIPSFQGIESVYLWLQTDKGLYTRGVNAYLTNEVLFVYPPLETNPVYDKTALFYQVDTGQYSGASVYHKLDTNSVSIVINTQPKSFDLSIAGSENHGTGVMFTRASRLLDGMTTTDDSGKVVFTEQPSLAISLNSARTVTKDYNNLIHIKSTDNPFPAMSKLIANQASIMEVVWMHADPFQMDPGHKIIYNYDRNGTMVTKTGILEYAEYRIARMGKMHNQDMFGCAAGLRLRLAPNESMSL